MLPTNEQPSLRAVSEAIQSSKQELDCFVASAPRNDVDKFGHNFAISPRMAREF
jgi:hypothetical protein